MYTLDASIHVSALNSLEPESGASQALLRVLHQRQIPLFCPTLLPVEVAAAIARLMDDADRAVALAALVRDWPNQTLVPLDGAVVDRAGLPRCARNRLPRWVAALGCRAALATGSQQARNRLAARSRLRGADAVYAAVAQQYGTTLITLDRQQLERLPPEVRIARPADVLGKIETGR